jgi:alkaline phosphatase D
MNKILTLFCLLCSIALTAQHNGANRSSVDPTLAPFYHGVASGDPLTDRIILWTRITTANASETVDWQIATDVNFANVVNSGTTTAIAANDHTVKVDATGLQPNTWYFYRFNSGSKYSLTGRTRTAPAGGIDSLRFAVLSCANLPVGYFNVYNDITKCNDVDAVLHLGDYIYEYKTASSVPGDTSRTHSPDAEILSLGDYRQRHSQYKLDEDLRGCHQQFPFIAVWDDHETANNSYKDGAGNHTEGAEGAWADRKNFGRQAYFEWMPIREAATGNDSIVHRTIRFGDLADLIMIDTRLEARDKQIPGFLVSTTNAQLNDSTRTLLGAGQLSWFKNELSVSSTKWRVIGNQVMIAQLTAGTSVVNTDQWDGYPYDRKRVYDHILQNNIKNVVFLTGDIHTSWANDLPYDKAAYDSVTRANSVAVEFVCTSVTSGSEIPISASAVQAQNPHMKFVELTKRGYVLLDLNKQRAQGDWIHFDSITTRDYHTTVAASWYVNDNERFLRKAQNALSPRTNMPAQAPATLTGVKTVKNNIVTLLCFPNPFTSELYLQYYLNESEPVTVNIIDMQGKVAFSKLLEGNVVGLHDDKVPVSQLAKGSYIVELKSAKGRFSKEMIKL